jgi:hypothetical protein
MTNLPKTLQPRFSDEDVVKYFDSYFDREITFSSEKLDAVFSFFAKRGFDTVAAISITTLLLEQTRRQDISIFSLLDRLKGTSDVELNTILTNIINTSRPITSTINYIENNFDNTFESRNIAP